MAVARVKAARAAIDRAGGDVVFTARAENFIRGVPDLDDAIRRLSAYKDAGADCLYAPGIKTREQIEAVVKAVAPKPVNFLNSGAFGFTVNDLAAMGVRRISVGGSLARVAMHAFIRTATEIARDGKFDGFAGLITNPELNKFFDADRKKGGSRDSRSEPHPRTGQPIGLPVETTGAGAASRTGNVEGTLWPSRKTAARALVRSVEGVCRARSASGPTFPPTGRSPSVRIRERSSPCARRQTIPMLMQSSMRRTAPSAIVTLLRICPRCA